MALAYLHSLQEASASTSIDDGDVSSKWRMVSLEESLVAAAASRDRADRRRRSLDDGEALQQEVAELSASCKPADHPWTSAPLDSMPLQPEGYPEHEVRADVLPATSADDGLEPRSRDDGGITSRSSSSLRGLPPLPPPCPELNFRTAFRWAPGGLECVSAYDVNTSDELPTAADVGGLGFQSTSSIFALPRANRHSTSGPQSSASRWPFTGSDVFSAEPTVSVRQYLAVRESLSELRQQQSQQFRGQAASKRPER